MKAWHNFWFWYHTSIGMNICCSVKKWLHHSNRAEIHELAAKQDKQLNVGDIVETEHGVFKVMSNKLLEDDHGVKPKRNKGVDGE